jgi:hypothetical protein
MKPNSENLTPQGFALALLSLLAVLLIAASGFADTSCNMELIQVWESSFLSDHHDFQAMLEIKDSTLYFAGHQHLYVFKIADSGCISVDTSLFNLMGSRDGLGDVSFSDTILFVSGYLGLYVLNISNPFRPESTYFYPRSVCPTWNLRVQDTLLVTMGTYIRCYNIKTLSAIFEVPLTCVSPFSHIIPNGYSLGNFTIEYPFIYLPGYIYDTDDPHPPISYWQTLAIWNIENNDSTYPVSAFSWQETNGSDPYYNTHNYSSSATQIAVYDSFVFRMGHNPAMRSYVANPSKTELHELDMWDDDTALYYSVDIISIAQNGTTLYCGMENQVAVFDLSNPSNIIREAYYKFDGNKEFLDICFKNNFIYAFSSNRVDNFKIYVFKVSDSLQCSYNFTPKNFDFSSYPNPFNSNCQISYDFSMQICSNLSIYNILGQKVEQLGLNIKDKGSIYWDASTQESGIYLIVAESENIRIVKKVLFIQ